MINNKKLPTIRDVDDVPEVSEVSADEVSTDEVSTKCLQSLLDSAW